MIAAAILAVSLASSFGAAAQSPQGTAPVANAGGPTWSSLSPAQQSALSPLKRDWQGIDTARKQKWLEIAARFPAMPPDERQRVQDRMNEWARMTPDERGRARLQFQEARQISPQDRQARWDAYLALPADERRALAKSASTVPPAPKAAAAGQPGKSTSALAATSNQKVNVVNVPSTQSAPKSIAPAVVQARPGASTTLISKTASPPPHAQVGQPKIAASQDVVNRSTLLPQTGPQSAAVAPPLAPGAAPGSAARR
ncbi:MAG: DUF3106 domain-containing protein [Rubrivivax sp.]